MFNQFPHNNMYRNSFFSRRFNYNPTFFNSINANTLKNENSQSLDSTNKEEKEMYKKQNIIQDDNNKENSIDSSSFKDSSNDKKSRSFGPILLSNNSISLLGFNFAIDDLLIIGLILILLLNSEKNYSLIIVLGLMFLNINLSDLNLFKII